MVGQKVLAALKNGSYRFESLEIHLHGNDQGLPSYRGPGAVSLQEHEHLSYTVYDVDSESTFFLGPHKPAGEFYVEEEMWRFELVDEARMSWLGGLTLVGTSGRPGEKGVTCRGRLDSMETHEEEPGKPDFLWLFFPSKIDLPFNTYTATTTERLGRSSKGAKLDTWVITDAQWELSLTKSEDGFEVSARPVESDVLPAGFDSRIEEAIWIVLGQDALWTLKNSRSQGDRSFTIRPQRQIELRPRIRPILHPDPSSSKDLGEFFKRYLRWAAGFSEPRFHPIAINMRRIISASAASVETEALELGVSVEAVVLREFPGWGAPQKKERENIQAALDFIDSWEGDDQIKARVTGSVNGLLRSNARTALKRLSEEEYFDPDLVNAWVKVRNTTAHGQEFKQPFEQVVRLCDKVYMLFMQILMYLFEYEGGHLAFHEPDWPRVSFPPPGATCPIPESPLRSADSSTEDSEDQGSQDPPEGEDEFGSAEEPGV